MFNADFCLKYIKLVVLNISQNKIIDLVKNMSFTNAVDTVVFINHGNIVHFTEI